MTLMTSTATTKPMKQNTKAKRLTCRTRAVLMLVPSLTGPIWMKLVVVDVVKLVNTFRNIFTRLTPKASSNLVNVCISHVVGGTTFTV